jgi:hypothetical protein
VVYSCHGLGLQVLLKLWHWITKTLCNRRLPFSRVMRGNMHRELGVRHFESTEQQRIILIEERNLKHITFIVGVFRGERNKVTTKKNCPHGCN